MMHEKLTVFSLDRPWLLMGIIAAITVGFLLQIPKITIDTDPENMLQPDQQDRVYYDAIKKEFEMDDIIVVGIVDPQGMFRTEALQRAQKIIAEIEKIDGIRREDIVSLTTTKNIFSESGAVRVPIILPDDFFLKPEDPEEFEAWFSVEVVRLRDFLEQSGLGVPTDYEELLTVKIAKVRHDIRDNPFLHEKVASEDGTAIAIYLPLISKKASYDVVETIRVIMDDNLLPGQSWHVAGLPIAEEIFGHEMFIQMAVVAPLAFLLIMVIIYLLFRQPLFLIPVGIVSMLSVIWAMGLLIGLDFTVHIMSSMIPVFLMPIAILDSVHILSVFFDRFSETGDKRESILWAMRQLYKPMFFTSLTSAVGFASLALADIPPVQVFGLFVSFGIFAAWLLSITLVPAIVNMLNEEKLASALYRKKKERKTLLDKVLVPVGNLSYRRAGWVMSAAVLAAIFGGLGIMQIQVNDNPVKWFKEGHPIRVADDILNQKFGGTYLTNLIIEGEKPPADSDEYLLMLESGIYPNLLNKPEVADYLSRMQAYLEGHEVVGKASSVYDVAKRVRYVFLSDTDPDRSLDTQQLKDRYYAIGLPMDFDKGDNAKKYLFEKTVIDALSDDEYDTFFETYGEMEDSPEYAEFVVSDKEKEAVLSRISFEFLRWSVTQFDYGASRDLKKLLTKETRELSTGGADAIEEDWSMANIWIQLRSGDNKRMVEVEQRLNDFIAQNKPPEGLKFTWTGLTYINKVWQDLMVNGMLYAVLGSFAIVFLLMLVEFRSLLLGLLAMVPLTLALLLSYGLMGWLGKDYDMPIAVCSALSLGLAIDFAIHFIQRYRQHFELTGDIEETNRHMFGEPGRAILRNAIVIAFGFLPLMISSLTPYVTVGWFFSLLMIMATLATLFVLPSALRYIASHTIKTGGKL